jgi:mono/diheme cytochrome c family protein
MRRSLFQFLLCVWVLVPTRYVLAATPDTPDRKPLTFEADVRPILKAHCWHCHGEEEELAGGLDARLARLLIQGGDSGPAIVPGESKASALHQRIAAGEMPPEGKPLSPQAVATIARWIDEGARTARPEPESLPQGNAFSDEERAHWSFQPIRRPPLPAVQQAGQIRQPVDAFLLAQLENERLSFAPEAERLTLLRRLHYDLTGLPPSPEEAERFLADPAEDAYEQLVDRLLASPAFGERWARHWLDVAGYADSDGYDQTDSARPWAYKYRDYVIRAFNADKPWNTFIVEQLAGDELLAPPYQNLAADDADRLIATGFLRMGPDGTATAEQASQDQARNDVLAETIKIVSTSVLGLSVGCAQCHAHRYDPITHEDYHRLRALFEPAYDWKQWRRPNERLVSLWSDEVRQEAEAVDAELQDIATRRTAELDQLVQQTLETELAKLPAAVQPLAKAAREKPEKDRSAEERQLVKEYPFLNVDRGSVYLYLPDRQTAFNKKWDELTERTKARRPVDDLVQCLCEVPGHVPPTHLFARGDFNSPRAEIAPGELSVLNASNWTIPADDPNLPTTGRRLAYARHLTDGTHPLVARVLVNRIWLHVFGRGIVSTPADFGLQGARPSHPDLLDWLADEFMRSGWRMKSLVRMLVTSRAYRQASARRPEVESLDPENALLARMSVRRLEAETIRDWLLATSGMLTPAMHGRPVPVMPDDVGQVVVGIDTRDSAGRPSGKVLPLGADEFRRSIYVQVRRSMPLGMLEPFDLPVMTPNCEQRNRSTVAPQSLLMMNSDLVVSQATALAERIQTEAGEGAAGQVRRLWLLAYARPPSDGELASALGFLYEQTAALAEQAAAEKVHDKQSPPGKTALAQLCHAVVSSNEFLYVD